MFTGITDTFVKTITERPEANPAIAAVKILNDIISEYTGNILFVYSEYLHQN